MKKTIIIAEAGVNHNGNISLAKKLIDHAKLAGADYIKFQLYKTNELVTENASTTKYQKNFDRKISQYQLLKKYELSKYNILKLKKYSKKKKIKFLLSVFDLKSLKFFKSLDLKIIKIPSGELNNFPLINSISELNVKVILSTGMSKIHEIKKTINLLQKKKIKDLTILYCVSSYPALPNNIEIKKILKYKKIFNYRIGFSDHSVTNEASLASIIYGARVIERHITLNKKLKGPDHSSSLNIHEFKQFVESVRRLEKIIITKKFIHSKDEKSNSLLVRKSIVANQKILKGEKFTSRNITTKRPGNGISSSKWFYILGKKAKKNFKKDDLITL